MAEISLALGKEEDAQHFGMLSEVPCHPWYRGGAEVLNQNVSSSYATTWQSLALSSDHQHILLSYEGDSSSWSMLYNLYADKLLSTGVISDDVSFCFRSLLPFYHSLPMQIYQLTTNFYKNLLASSAGN